MRAKHQIEHDQIRRVVIDKPQGLDPVSRFLDVVASDRERHPKKPSQLVVVFNDQNSLRAHSPR